MAKETRTNNPHAQAPRLPLSPGLPTAPGAADQASLPQALQINMINWYYDNKGSLRYEIWVLNSENKNKPDGSILGRYILLQAGVQGNDMSLLTDGVATTSPLCSDAPSMGT